MEVEAAFAAVILAAGASTRLGQPKQLVAIGSESLLRRTARLAMEAGCAPVVVVLGFEAERMIPELDGLRALAVRNEEWPHGMGSSLRRGLQAIAQLEVQPAGVLLLVCDQARLAPDHLRYLLEAQGPHGSRITASAYAGGVGVPAVFGRDFFAELQAIEGDRGAREVIRRHTDVVRVVPWEDGALDLDQPEDLTGLEAP